MTSEADRRLMTLTTWLTACVCFIVVFAISVMGIMVWQAVRVGQQSEALKAVAEETHDTLCAFKGDLERRFASGGKFLKENPDGIPGISAAQIQQSLSNQRATLESLKTLNCEGES